MGLGLDALARTGGHTHLAFASIEAYALERCERSATWTRQSRKLALRTRELPCVRRALISGRLSWSMALEVARVATAEDEAQWIQLSGQCTVSRFRALVKELRGQPDSSDNDPATEEEPEAHCLLTVTANREDTWLYECAKMVFRHVEGGTTSDLVEAIVAEATTTMMELLPKDAADPNDLAPSYDAQNAWNRQLAKYREEAERLCDSRVLKQKDDGIATDAPDDTTISAARPKPSIASSDRYPASLPSATSSSANSPRRSGTPTAGDAWATRPTDSTPANASAWRSARSKIDGNSLVACAD